jgi:hypothetical protein
MNLDEKFAPVRVMFYDLVGNFFKKLAGLFGYPTRPGMPTISDLTNESSRRSQFFDRLPNHETSWPPMQRPNTWFEMIFGAAPKLEIVPRYIYENKEEGFYNFYIENYKNLYFLPDWLSEFLQIKLNICFDLTILETIREVLFVGLMIYSQIVLLRIALTWFIYINPFTFPWCYLTAAVDWTEDVLLGLLPTVLGINLTGSLFLGILGILADSLNHLIFTMPFLPSEAEEATLLINEQLKNVLVFHYLPILWYRYPIPNDLRTFWYTQRPDILEYMQKVYRDLNIQFLPDGVEESVTKPQFTASLSSHTLLSEITSPSEFSNDLFSLNPFVFHDSLRINLTHMPGMLFSLATSDLEKLI